MVGKLEKKSRGGRGEKDIGVDVWRRKAMRREGGREGGAVCLQVPLIKGNLGSPPLSYLSAEPHAASGPLGARRQAWA